MEWTEVELISILTVEIRIKAIIIPPATGADHGAVTLKPVIIVPVRGREWHVIVTS